MIFELDNAFELAKERKDAKRAAIAAEIRARQRRTDTSRARNSFKRRRADVTGPVCEGCGWDGRKYGLGERQALSVLNSHHVIPASCKDTSEADENFALLCPNCHALAHQHGSIIWHSDTHVRSWNGPVNRRELLALLTNSSTDLDGLRKVSGAKS